MDDKERIKSIEIELWGINNNGGFCAETQARLAAIELWKESGRFTSCPYLQGKDRRENSLMRTIKLVSGILGNIVSVTAIILFILKLVGVV